MKQKSIAAAAPPTHCKTTLVMVIVALGVLVPVTYKNEPYSPAEIGDTTNVPLTPELIVISTVGLTP